MPINLCDETKSKWFGFLFWFGRRSANLRWFQINALLQAALNNDDFVDDALVLVAAHNKCVEFTRQFNFGGAAKICCVSYTKVFLPPSRINVKDVLHSIMIPRSEHCCLQLISNLLASCQIDTVIDSESETSSVGRTTFFDHCLTNICIEQLFLIYRSVKGSHDPHVNGSIAVKWRSSINGIFWQNGHINERSSQEWYWPFRKDDNYGRELFRVGMWLELSSIIIIIIYLFLLFPSIFIGGVEMLTVMSINFR